MTNDSGYNQNPEKGIGLFLAYILSLFTKNKTKVKYYFTSLLPQLVTPLAKDLARWRKLCLLTLQKGFPWATTTLVELIYFRPLSYLPPIHSDKSAVK